MIMEEDEKNAVAQCLAYLFSPLNVSMPCGCQTCSQTDLLHCNQFPNERTTRFGIDLVADPGRGGYRR